MSSPRNLPDTTGVIAFLLGAVVPFAAILAGSQMLNRGASLAAQSTSPGIHASQHSNSAAARISIFDQLLSDEDCSRAILSRAHEGFGTLVGEQKREFWTSNPNAAVFLRQLSKHFAQEIAPTQLTAEVRKLLQDADLDPDTMRSLMVSSFAGVLEGREVPRELLIAILRSSSPDQALALLETWLEFQRPTNPADDLELATAIASQVFPNLDQKGNDDLAEMIVRIWAHRAPPVADMLRFTAKIEEAKRDDLKRRLSEISTQMLAVANPAETLRRFVERGAQTPREAGLSAASAGFSLEKAREIARQLSPQAADEFLGNYLSSLCWFDPREMSKVASGTRSQDWPESARARITVGLMTTGDFATFDEWLKDLDPSSQAKLLDDAFAPFASGNVSPSSVRYYLKTRPQSEPPSFWAMHTFTWALPANQADEVLKMTEQIPDGDMRRQAREEIYSRQLTSRIKENPDLVPEYLSQIPESDRAAAMRSNFSSAAWDLPLNSSLFLRWMNEAKDASLRDQIGSGLLQAELEQGTLAQVQARTLELLRSSSNPDAYQESVGALVKELASTSSSAGAALIDQLPSGSLRDRVTANFVRQWAEFDPVAASDWLADQPSGPGRDRATQELVICSRDDPERALANAAGIQNPAMRFEAARSVLRTWRDFNPAQAASALAAAGFSKEELPQLQAILRQSKVSEGARP